MVELGKSLKWLFFAVLITPLACSEQDADRLSKVGNKALDTAADWTSNAGEKISLSLRNAKAGLDQLEVTGRVQARLSWDKQLQGTSIKAQATKADVTLSGTVKDDLQRLRAVELAKTTMGVDKVIDALEIAK